MRAPRKPHPRSLDALFPRPKVRRCPVGHSQTPEWRPIHGCSTCIKAEAEFARRQWERTDERRAAATVERKAKLAELDRLPNPYILYTTDGSRQVFRVPRGPRRSRRIRSRA